MPSDLNLNYKIGIFTTQNSQVLYVIKHADPSKNSGCFACNILSRFSPGSSLLILKNLDQLSPLQGLSLPWKKCASPVYLGNPLDPLS